MLLLNISKSKGNQKMKLGQLIERNMRNIFLNKYFRKCGEETIPRKFKIEHILDQ